MVASLVPSGLPVDAPASVDAVVPADDVSAVWTSDCVAGSGVRGMTAGRAGAETST